MNSLPCNVQIDNAIRESTRGKFVFRIQALGPGNVNKLLEIFENV